MKKQLVHSVLLAGVIPLLAVAPVSAGASGFYSDFASQPASLYFTNFEQGGRSPGVACGTDACASFETAGSDNFMRIAVNPSAHPGSYTNTDVSQVQLGVPGATNSGPYTATYGHPVTLEARIKWSGNYDALGLGDAQGTSGIALWNSAIESPDTGPGADYAQIGFTWASKDVLLGVISGFSGSSFVNQLPVGVSRPLSVNVNDWMNVKMVWSENILGVQTVQYYLNGSLYGAHVLPVNLQGLSLEAWNDNQEPYPCVGGTGGYLCFNYPNPSQSQSLYVDYARITQP